MFKLLAQCFLKLTGWKVEGERPEMSHFVMIAAPHTSNWDFLYMLAIAKTLGLKPSWVGKHTMFRWPFGGLMRKLGGIAVNRKTPGTFVKMVAEAFETKPRLELVIPPEGTRSFRPFWKSGFYRIAKAADVPVVLSFLDYGRKVGGIGPSFVPSDDISSDMNIVRKFYSSIDGAYPDQFGTPVLKEERTVQSEPAV